MSSVQAVREFLGEYNQRRFADDEGQAIESVEHALEKCLQDLSS